MRFGAARSAPYSTRPLKGWSNSGVMPNSRLWTEQSAGALCVKQADTGCQSGPRNSLKMPCTTPTASSRACRAGISSPKSKATEITASSLRSVIRIRIASLYVCS